MTSTVLIEVKETHTLGIASQQVTLVEEKHLVVNEVLSGAVVVEKLRSVDVISVAQQGAEGIPGESAALDNFEAAISISALRVLASNSAGKAVYASSADAASASRAIGISTTSANTGESLPVRSSGVLSDNGWNWNMAAETALFLGTDGAITQGFAGGAAALRIGHALSATSIFIELGQPIITS